MVFTFPMQIIEFLLLVGPQVDARKPWSISCLVNMAQFTIDFEAL
jgi:hypothetical protein